MKRKYIHMSILLAGTLLLSMFLYNFSVFAAEFQVEIGSVQGSPGEIVTVPISFKNVPEKGVNSCDFVIHYNSSAFQVVEEGVTPGPITKNASLTFDYQIDSENGTIKFLYSDDTGLGSEAILTDGIFADIKFLIKENTPASFNIIKIVGDMVFGNTALEYMSPGIIKGSIEVIARQGYTLIGYVAPDFAFGSRASGILKSGFNVEITGTNTRAQTDGNGFFEIHTYRNTTSCSLTITKTGFLQRVIENINLDDSMGYTEVSAMDAPIKMWVGDINQDNAINMADIMEICKGFNTTKGQSSYKSEYDVNKDDAVNMEDIMVVAQHFNRTAEDYK